MKSIRILTLVSALMLVACGSDESSNQETTVAKEETPVAANEQPSQEAQAESEQAQAEQEAQVAEAQAQEPVAPQPKDLVDTAASAGQFTILVQALQSAGLEETLRGQGPYTVFAPTDEAFNKLAKGKLESLLKPENKAQLTKILTYHVVQGEVKAADVASMKKATTVNGKDLKIRAKNDEVKINKAKVLSSDIQASNGVIHVIDTVLLPAGK